MCKFCETIPLNYLQKHIENDVFWKTPDTSKLQTS
jgi:hypothetical protein